MSSATTSSFVWKKISNWKKVSVAFGENRAAHIFRIRTILYDWLCAVLRDQYPLSTHGQFSSMAAQLTFTYIDRHIYGFYEQHKDYAEFQHLLQLFGIVGLHKTGFALHKEDDDYMVISRTKLIDLCEDAYTMKEFNECYSQFPDFKYTHDIPMNYLANYDDAAVHKCAEIMISDLAIDLAPAKIAEQALLWAAKDPKYDNKLEISSLTFRRVTVPDKLQADYQVKPFVYTMEKHLGSGSFGDVYRARDPNGNIVAIKLLRHLDPDYYKETFFEYHTIQDLASDCKEDKPKSLLSYIDCGFFLVTDTRVKMTRIYMCTVMEYFDGVELQDIEVATLTQIETILKSILECVNYLHSKGYAHRDIKPTNILVKRSTLEIKVIDYGTLTSDAKRHISHDVIRGTHVYLSPVTFATPKEAYSTKDWQKEDIWAIGQTIYNIVYLCSDPDSLKFYGPINSCKNGPTILRNIKRKNFSSWTKSEMPLGKLGQILKLMFTIESDKRPTTAELLKIL